MFRSEMLAKVLAGKKTQTRRPLRPHCFRYQAGRSYAVTPGRGKRAVARILVLDVHEERLGDITLAGARAEGFKSTLEFKLYWDGLSRGLDIDSPVQVITFELDDAIELDDAPARARKAPR
jgi:hypothetical protein